MLATEKLAEGFSGIEQGAGVPGQVLSAFKAAAPYLGYSPREVHAIDWLFKFTQPSDWGEGARPIVWPSASLQREALGLGLSQVKALNRQLIEAGLITMKDSPNGKRYGRRDGKGRIVEAYGFDLSPLAARQAEFLAVAAHGRAERERMRLLRRRATIARKGLSQIMETVAELELTDADWLRLEEEGRALARSLAKLERLDEMELGVVSLERRQQEARERLENLLPQQVDTASKAVDSDPKGPENRPHIIPTNHPLNPEQDTVMASEGCKSGAGRGVIDPTPGSPQGEQRSKPPERSARTDSGTVMRLSTDELVQLAPRLKPYLRTSAPGWPEIIDAADWLRHDLGVSKPLWGEACLAMGREEAAIALAIVSAKPKEHFTSSPGGYFHGMVTRAKAGELNLARTVWGLRSGGKQANGQSYGKYRDAGNRPVPS
jgi:replication initiation protein RepC